MTPNINLHIESTVLVCIDLAPGQSQLLQQSVASQLSEMLITRSIGSTSSVDSCYNESRRDNSFRPGGSADAMSRAPQLAYAIYTNIPQSELGPRASHEGQP
jgi:hypothetical protein